MHPAHDVMMLLMLMHLRGMMLDRADEHELDDAHADELERNDALADKHELDDAHSC